MSMLEAERRRVYPGIDQFLLRGTIVLGAMTALVAAQAAGARPAAWLTAGLVASALWAAFRPDSTALVVLLGGTAYEWALVPEPRSWLVLVVSGGMVLVHVSALLAAQGPARMRVDRAQLRCWLVRLVLLWAASAMVWVGVVLLEDQPGSRPAYAAGLVTLIGVAVVASRLIGRRGLVG
jgi:hypothetical protein